MLLLICFDLFLLSYSLSTLLLFFLLLIFPIFLFLLEISPFPFSFFLSLRLPSFSFLSLDPDYSFLFSFSPRFSLIFFLLFLSFFPFLYLSNFLFSSFFMPVFDCPLLNVRLYYFPSLILPLDFPLGPFFLRLSLIFPLLISPAAFLVSSSLRPFPSLISPRGGMGGVSGIFFLAPFPFRTCLVSSLPSYARGPLMPGVLLCLLSLLSLVSLGYIKPVAQWLEPYIDNVAVIGSIPIWLIPFLLDS